MELKRAASEHGAGSAPMELSPTARVVLGMIGLGCETGYDIKQLVDNSTRYFWAASYGQIYPELRRLEEQGLVIGRSSPNGGRARTVYELTDAGREALNGWLRSGAGPIFELRDEPMLKLFFSDAAPEQRPDLVRHMRRVHEQKLFQLQAIDAAAAGTRTGPYLALQLGMRVTQAYVDWCRETERRMADGKAD